MLKQPCLSAWEPPCIGVLTSIYCHRKGSGLIETFYVQNSDKFYFSTLAVDAYNFSHHLQYLICLFGKVEVTQKNECMYNKEKNCQLVLSSLVFAFPKGTLISSLPLLSHILCFPSRLNQSIKESLLLANVFQLILEQCNGNTRHGACLIVKSRFQTKRRKYTKQKVSI